MNKKSSLKWITAALIVMILSLCAISVYFLAQGKKKYTKTAQGIDSGIAKYGALYISDFGNLLYQRIDGSSISLEEGETIHISVENREQYNDVFIFLISGNNEPLVQKIGTLDSTTPFSFPVSVSGEYVIYAGEKDTNITDKVIIEYLRDAEDSKDSLLTPLAG